MGYFHKPTTVNDTQPRGVPVIDWSNPLSRDLEVCYVPQAGYSPNLGKYTEAGGILLSGYAGSDSVSISQNRDGKGLLTTSGDAVDTNGLKDILENPINDFDQQAFSNNTFVFFAKILDDIEGPQILYSFGGTGSGLTVYYKTSPDTIGLQTTISSTDSQADSTSTYVVGDTVLVVVTSDGSTHTLYINGVQEGQLTSKTLGTNTGGLHLHSSDINVLAGCDNFGGISYLFAGYNRVLTSSEIKSISTNPWQIFKAEQPYTWINTAAASETGYYLENLGRVNTVQPRNIPVVDWGNPLSHGLTFATDLGGEVVYDAVSGASPVKNDLSTKENRLTARQSVGDGTNAYSFTQLGLQNAFTLVCGVKRLSYAAAHVRHLSLSDVSTTNVRISLGRVGTGGSTTIWRLNPNDGTTNLLVDSGNVTSNNTPAVLVGTYSDTECTLSVDGVQVDSDTTGQTMSGLDTITVHGVSYSGGLSDIVDSSAGTDICLVYSRVLSDAEIKSISANPWQIFKSEAYPVFMGSAAVTPPATGYTAEYYFKLLMANGGYL